MSAVVVATIGPASPKEELSRVDGNISDLFFNTDVDLAVVKDAKGMFSHYNEAILREEAACFLGCLERLNVAVPTVDELIADFYRRI